MSFFWWCLNFVAFQILFLTVVTKSASSSGFVEHVKFRGSHGRSQNITYGVTEINSSLFKKLSNINYTLPSKMAVQWTLSDVFRTFAVCLTNISLHTFRIPSLQWSQISFYHGKTSCSCIADRILPSQVPGSQGTVGERRLQSVQQINYDVDELKLYIVT